MVGAFGKVYIRIWPVIFLVFGILGLAGVHLHYEIWGMHISGHSLMWIFMAAAHADVFWGGRGCCPCGRS